MFHNFVEKDKEGNYILKPIGARIIVKNSSLEGFVKEIKTLQKEGTFPEGGVYTGVSSESDPESLNAKEHKEFWKLYDPSF